MSAFTAPQRAGQSEPAATERPISERASGRTTTILMVEDEETLREPVSKILRRRGFTVLEAGDGISAVELFRQQSGEIDIVVLDITLPAMSGIDVLTELQRIQPDAKVVLTSAYGQETVMSAVGEGRPWAYIRKPYSPSDLAALLFSAGAAGPQAEVAEPLRALGAAGSGA